MSALYTRRDHKVSQGVETNRGFML